MDVGHAPLRARRRVLPEGAHDDDPRHLRTVRAAAVRHPCLHHPRRRGENAWRVLGCRQARACLASPDRSLGAAGIARHARFHAADNQRARFDGRIRGSRACCTHCRGVSGNDEDPFDLRQHRSQLGAGLRPSGCNPSRRRAAARQADLAGCAGARARRRPGAGRTGRAGNAVHRRPGTVHRLLQGSGAHRGGAGHRRRWQADVSHQRPGARDPRWRTAVPRAYRRHRQDQGLPRRPAGSRESHRGRSGRHPMRGHREGQRRRQHDAGGFRRAPDHPPARTARSAARAVARLHGAVPGGRVGQPSAHRERKGGPAQAAGRARRARRDLDTRALPLGNRNTGGGGLDRRAGTRGFRAGQQLLRGGRHIAEDFLRGCAAAGCL